MKQQIQTNKIEWKEVEIGELLDYEQPGNYIVQSEILKEKTKSSVPVLTANKSFILGYTEEKKGIYENPPVIIFDDFTTDTKFVDFKFKVKSSAMKLLRPKSKNVNLKFVFLMMKGIQLNFSTHKRYYLSVYQKRKILMPFKENKLNVGEQERIVKILEEAEKLNERGKKIENLFNEFLKSVFYEMFYNKGFEEVSLGEKRLYEEIFAGGDVQKTNLSRTKTEKFKFPIFTNGEKNKGFYGYTDKPRVIKPSVTISARGTIGYSEIRDEPFYPAIRLIVLTPHKNILNLIFLKYSIVNTINFNLDGTSIPQLTIPMINRYKFPLPPIPFQQKFATIVEQVEQMKENIKKTKQNSEELFNSLMQKAFRGEL